MSDIVLEELETAEEFLEVLGPLHNRWLPDPRDWVFRGHSDARWLLIPNALRNDTTFGYRSEASRGLRATPGAQIEAEFDMLEQFVVALDRHGFSLPGNLHTVWFEWGRIQDDVRSTTRSGGRMWPPNELLGLLALAQHHGVPTRMLDWTRSARIAAYFAADRAARWVRDGFPMNPPATHLSVWAFREAATRGLWRAEHDHISLVGTPSGQNANMRAQQGLFTVHMQQHREPYEVPAAVSVDEMLANALEDPATGWAQAKPSINPILCEFTLPVTEAPRLLRLLSYEGITYASIFPTLDGVVGSLIERRYWG